MVIGTGAAVTALPILAEQLLAPRRQRDEIAAQVEGLVEAHPLHEVLASMPVIDVGTCARILTEVTGKHFASAAFGLLRWNRPVYPPPPETSIRSEHPSRRGNKKLKRALFSAFAPCIIHRPGAYYDPKRAEGKRHNQAVIALARRRSDILFAMLHDNTLYEDPAPKNLPSAA